MSPTVTEPPVLESVLFDVAYDGTLFHGFAPQRDARTVHGVLLAAIREVDSSIADVRGASRTDARVHARGQLVAFDPARAIPPAAWQAEVNRRLPEDVAVVRARCVASGFVPRFEAAGKRYIYEVKVSSMRDPLERHRAWVVPFGVSPERVGGELAALVGTHDFRAFRRAADRREDTVRTIARAEVTATHPHLRIAVEGSGFLYNMVRIVVGTAVEVGANRRRPGAIARAIVSGARGDLGLTAPPQGLCLDRVFLPGDDDLPRPFHEAGKNPRGPRVRGSAPIAPCDGDDERRPP